MLTVPPRDRLKNVERSPIAVVGAGDHNYPGDAVPPASTHPTADTTTINARGGGGEGSEHLHNSGEQLSDDRRMRVVAVHHQGPIYVFL